MSKIIRFIELELINFTNHRSLKESYGDITKLSGKNGEGKTSFGTAPAWVLFGTDLLGSKFNPSPTTYEFDRVFASLSMSVDDNEIKFAREIDEKGKNAFYINDVPTKAKEFESTVAGLFDKDEFLSLYNPSYFFTLHWTKQREQVMKYTTAPAKSEVFAEMSRTNPEQKVKDIPLNPAAQKLDELTKKHSLDDLAKIHGGTGGQKSKLDKQYIAAQSKTKTLQEQLERLGSQPAGTLEEKRQFEVELRAKIKTEDEVVAKAWFNNKDHSDKQVKINLLQEQINRSKEKWPELKNEPIQDTCRTCGQKLTDDAVKVVVDDKEKRITKYKSDHQDLIDDRNRLQEDLSKIEIVDVSDQQQKVRTLEDQLDNVLSEIRFFEEFDRLKADVEQAKKDEASTLASLKESIFILDAIKAYRAKEAVLQAEKVQSLFTTLSVRLFKYVKTNDEWEPDFSIQMNGKDYVALSTGEKIAAGLELADVLFQQSELIVPTFIDGIGEYTGKVAVYGQLITGRAVYGQELKIETEELNNGE